MVQIQMEEMEKRMSLKYSHWQIKQQQGNNLRSDKGQTVDTVKHQTKTCSACSLQFELFVAVAAVDDQRALPCLLSQAGVHQLGEYIGCLALGLLSLLQQVNFLLKRSHLRQLGCGLLLLQLFCSLLVLDLLGRSPAAGVGLKHLGADSLAHCTKVRYENGKKGLNLHETWVEAS